MRTFEIGADRHLHPITDAEPSPDWLRDEPVRWVVCSKSDPHEVEALCQSCGVELPPQVSETLRDPPPHPSVVGLERVLFVSYVFAVGDKKRSGFAVCAPSTILTFHKSSDLVEAVVRDCQHERKVRAKAPLAVLLELIDGALEQLSDRVFHLRRKLVILSDELESGSKQLEPEDHLALKQEATALEILFEDHLYYSAEIAKFDSESVDASLVRPLLVQTQGDLTRGLRAVGRLNGRINDLHQFQESQADETTNRRLKILTVLSAIYLPATLIAGIYGMNFNDIPITSVPHGYVIVMAIMAAVVVGQLVFFYKRGWFK